jgi:rhamnogalacturonyl hydrolase YesR
MKRDLVRHLGALSKFQDVTGMWQQVIDEPGSYRELTCTCMIGYALVEGIQRGWLPEEEFGPLVQKAWEGVKVRVGRDGKLIDVCTGTGKQKSLRDYLDRTAILGIDERGGAMAMMFAAAMAEWEQAKSR